MMRKSLLVGFLLLSTLVSGQSDWADLQWGERLQNDDVGFLYGIGTTKQGYYIVGQNTQTNKYDKYIQLVEVGTGSILGKYEIPFDDYHKKPTRLNWTYKQDNEIHILFSVKISERKERVLYKSVLNEAGEYSEPRELAALDDKGGFGFQKSKDRSKLLLFMHPEYKGRKDEKFELKVLDEDYNTLYGGEVRLPVRDKHFVFSDYKITNAGDIFILGYSTPDWTKGEKAQFKGPNRDYSLFKISKGSKDVEVHKLSISNKFISSIWLQMDYQQDLLVITGLYSESSLGLCRGYFMTSIDQNNGRVKKEILKPFDMDLMTKFMKEKKVNKGGELWYFGLKKVIFNDEGGAIMVAEQSLQKTYNEEHTSGTYTKYYKEDILAFEFDKDGELLWNRVIPKRQYSSSSKHEVSSFLFKKGADGALHFIFNDHPKNWEDRVEGNNKALSSRITMNYKKAFLVMATIDANKELTYEKLLDCEESKLVPFPRYSKYMGGDKILMYGWYNKECAFGVLTFGKELH